MTEKSRILLFMNDLMEKRGPLILHLLSAIVGVRVLFEMTDLKHQLLATIFSVTFVLSSVFRKQAPLFYPLFVISLLTFTLITIFSSIDLFTLLSLAYNFLFISAFLIPNPFINLLVGTVFISLLLTYQDSNSIYLIKGNIVSVAVNTVVYSLFAFLIKYLFKKKIDLQESERSNQLLLSLLPDPLVIHQNGEIVFVNQEGLKLLRAKTQNEVVGKTIFNFIQSSHHEVVMSNIESILTNPELIPQVDIKISTLNDELIDIETMTSMINYNGKPALLSRIRDITSQKNQTEELIQKSDKLSLVGQLAAGIAHEIRNPLTSLRGFIQLLQYKTEENKEYCDIMLSELDRINLIVGEFLILAKPQMIKFSNKNINHIIRHVVTLIGTQAIINNIDMDYKLTKNLPMVSCEENQLKQVIINLIKNAIEAMPDGGTIHVQTGLYDEDMIFIKVIDEGYGIPEEMIAKLGEPFYTTKEQGTGLGLMVCYNIIENHQGQMKVYSEVNKGTTFEIILPISTNRVENVERKIS
ncbi:ATP-binding protein [Neobacillus sp. D3-1R]|uniref:ATP-binding protein n=1 Tax=Neobacillus sp. D3-1R TaxID=3445778 RepID=UPI003FA0339A